MEHIFRIVDFNIPSSSDEDGNAGEDCEDDEKSKNMTTIDSKTMITPEPIKRFLSRLA